MSIYDIIGGQTFDKKKWAAQKQAQRQEAYEKVDVMCQEMAQGGSAFQRYLDAQGRFDRYSVSNAILVAAVKPEAVQLKEMKEWRRLGAYVDKKAAKVVILEPGDTYTRQDGSKAVSYNPKELYDISDTSFRDKREEAYETRQLVSALIDTSPVGFEVTESLEVGAYYDREQNKIFVKTGLSEAQLFGSMAKEVAAAVIADKYPQTADAEFKAYCVSYMLAKRYRVDTGGYHFDQLPEQYISFTPKELREELTTLKVVMMEIQLEMHRSLEKERGSKRKEMER